jgi:hypothetical protein
MERFKLLFSRFFRYVALRFTEAKRYKMRMCSGNPLAGVLLFAGFHRLSCVVKRCPLLKPNLPCQNLLIWLFNCDSVFLVRGKVLSCKTRQKDMNILAF